MKYAKPVLSVNEQMALLQQRGMVIADLSDASHTLHHINYYRLRAYCIGHPEPEKCVVLCQPGYGDRWQSE